MMASITIRNLDEDIKRRLRMRAAGNNRSMEEEVRKILDANLRGERHIPGFAEFSAPSPVDRLVSRFAEVGGVELELPSRGPSRPAPDFSGPEFGE